jgi:hypothetical protein
MNWPSIRAVLTGAIVAIVVTTVIDVGLHVAGVFPPISQPIDDTLALLASSYRVVIGIGSAWLTARLAPKDPMKHAIILGAMGAAVALVGVPGSEVVPHFTGHPGVAAILGGRPALNPQVRRGPVASAGRPGREVTGRRRMPPSQRPTSRRPRCRVHRSAG